MKLPESMNIETFTLPNGLKVILEPIESARSVAIYTAVAAGPRYETKETAGLAHFLEHMLLEGTKSFPNAKEVAEYVENVGGKYGAFTEKDHVIYHVKMLPEQVERGLDFIHQILFNPLLSPKDIEKEKNIVFEEMKRAEDNPEVEVWDVFNEWVWGKNQTLGRSTLGYPETISNVTQEKLLTYLSMFYRPANMVISIVGKMDSKKVKKILEKLFIEENNKDFIAFDKAYIIKLAKKIKLVPYKSQQAQMILGFPNTVTYNHPDRYALSVVATLLGGAVSARLFYKLVYELGIAYSTGAYNWIGYDVGLFSIYGGFSVKNIHKAVNIILDELVRLKTVKLSERELKETKEKTKANIFFYTETTDNLASMYASQLATEKRIISLEKMEQEINKIKAEDILRVSRRYFTNEYVRLLVRGAVDKSINTELEKLIYNFN